MFKSIVAILAYFAFSFSAQAASKSYKELVVNNDGSLTIVQPWFTYDGRELPISARFSDANGVCHLYGFQSVLASLASGDHPLTAVINSDGWLGNYANYSANYYNTGVTTIICKAMPGEERAKPVLTDRAEKVYMNDDGSTTVYNPFFLNGTGNQVGISARFSDATGVCKYFGFNNFRAMTTVGDEPTTLAIGENGSPSGFVAYASNYYNTRIQSIACDSLPPRPGRRGD